MKTLRQIKDDAILERIKVFGGSKYKAAKSLGINVNTVYEYTNRMKTGVPKRVGVKKDMIEPLPCGISRVTDKEK